MLYSIYYNRIEILILDSKQTVFVGVIIFFFFFQAEDGIRDCLLSRGLGDVYKRQDYSGIFIMAQNALERLIQIDFDPQPP